MCPHRPLSTFALGNGSLPCPCLCLHSAQRTVTCSFQVVPHDRQCTEEGITVLLLAGGACTRTCGATPSQKSYGCHNLSSPNHWLHTGSRHRSSGTKSCGSRTNRSANPFHATPASVVAWPHSPRDHRTTCAPWVEGPACCAGPHPLCRNLLRGGPRPPKGLTSLPLLHIHCRPHTFSLSSLAVLGSLCIAVSCTTFAARHFWLWTLDSGS